SVDLIIGGHSHTVLNRDGLCADNIVNGIPIVQTGAHGEYLGQVELTIQKKNITVTGASLIPTDSLQVDQAFEDNEMQPFIKRARELWGQPLGQVENIPDLSTKAVLNDFAKRELALANFIADALVERLTQRGFLVDFAMIDASTLQCGLPFSDNLTYGDCFEVMPFTDTLRLYQITGRQLQDLFTDNVLRIDRPNDPHTERGFLQFSREVEYTIELGKMRTDGRAKGIRVRKTPLARLATTTFTIATTSFNRKLAAPWEAAWNRTQDTPLLDLYQFPFIETDFLLRQEMVTYIQDHGGVTRAGGAQRDGRLRVRI
ncbi:MAG: 5'-nucleotidase C-terminal domain-containing protein, partial [Anaerolineales bacterium]|nr:5'-nucleotidase C-terminal domain-containing protein [Anaerolineales bacterium]